MREHRGASARAAGERPARGRSAGRRGALSGALTLAASAFALSVVAAAPARAQVELPVSLRDSFPLGSGGNALCQVQSRIADAANRGPFDRTWAVVCRDSALPVGYVFALRGSESEIAARLAERRAGQVDCAAPAGAAGGDMLGGAAARPCVWRDPALEYLVAVEDGGKAVYAVEGFAAYRSALDLALRSVRADTVLPGEVEVATIAADDSEAYARIQALSLDPLTALAEGYRRNAAGDYADAAAYFETLDQRQAGSEDRPIDRVEFLINAGLQRSNLGQFAEADRLFADAAALPAGSGVIERLRRNYETIHQLNQGRPEAALARLGEPLRATSASGADVLRGRLELTDQLARRINAADRGTNSLGLIDDLKLTADERAAILDAQALQLAGVARRLSGDRAGARAALNDGLIRAIAVRNGRVVSIVRMRAQMLTELADIEEADGNPGAAEDLLRSARDIVAVQYPETRSLAAAEARLAALLVRQGKRDEALALYRSVIGRSVDRRNALSGLSRQMAPYFDLLVGRMGSDPAASGEFFTASQVLVRPGVAETQAVLSRELSAGDDEAARLFRQSVSLGRSIERLRIRYAALRRLEDAAARQGEIDAVAQEIAGLEAQEQATVVRMADFARYRVVAPRVIGEDELRQGLAPGEMYLKLAVLGPDVFVYAMTGDGARGYRAATTGGELDAAVTKIRDSISRYENGQYITSAFAVDEARRVFRSLLDPIAGEIGAARHVIFEPDGAMLRLPLNLLVADDASVATYVAQAERPDGDPFDMRGVAWLGRDKLVSTAVSARGFVEARTQPLSNAREAYLGMGNNARVSALAGPRLGVRAGMSAADANPELGCDWPLAQWNNPIAADELVAARGLLANAGAELVTGSAFTDTAIKTRGDLANFRILHFATHGLVTPPRPDCPVRPALLTSFGSSGSDGLLTFAEIFDLRLDADMVILSACDTAGQADVATTRAAGLASGGGTALDGLVRAFVGAGGRAVLASHWPAPDDFDATKRLITGLFEADAGTPSGAALLTAQQGLMSVAETSHPFYWAGFAVIGDGARPLVRTATASTPVPQGAR